MSRFFINRPIFASVISIIVVIAGVVSFGGLPVAKFPPISPPTVRVAANYPGANAAVVAETVATPIEQEVNGVEGMMYMSSNSTSDGQYTLNVTFELGTDIDMATVLVQNRVAIANAKLPEEVRRQGVTTIKQSTQILQFVTLTSDSDRYDDLFLSNFALKLKDELARVSGIGSVTLFGAGDYSMRLWLDPRKLDARGLTTEEVVNAIREQNQQVAAGQIGAPPAPPGTAFQYTINTLGRLATTEQFGNIILKAGESGRLIRVKDVTVDDNGVELGAKDYRYASRYNGVPCTTMTLYQLPGANALSVANAVRHRMSELQARSDWPPGIKYQVALDTTDFVKASIQEVYSTIFLAIGLVVLVIYIFLQDWRATIVPVVAIPVALIGTFGVMAALGFSINMLSLFGIVLAIGIVVDDAIVVVESTSTYLSRGLSSKDAAIKAMEEITGPVIATTLVLLAVFVPTAFMSGITGQLYKQFALTISAAVVLSTINALTLSPALCGIVLRPPREQTFFFFRWFNATFDRFSGRYDRLIRLFVVRVPLVLAAYFGLLALIGWTLPQLPTGFVPTEDQGYVFVDVQLPDAASRQRTEEVIRQLDAIVAELPGVQSQLSVSGYSLLAASSGSNVAFSAIVLEPWSERTDPSLSQEAIIAELKRRVSSIQEAIVFAFIPPPIDGLGNAGGFQMEVEDRGAAGYQTLQAAADELVAQASTQSRIAGLKSSFRASAPQLFAEVDRTQVKAKDVPLSSVFGTLQSYLGSAYVNDFTLNGRTYQVRLQADGPFRASPDDILNLRVRNRKSEAVPLRSLIDVQEDFGPSVIRRYNLYPSASVNGAATAGTSSGQALELMEQAANETLPASFGYEWTGLSYQEKNSGGQLLIFGLAVVAVFLVLAAQYESWTSPAAVIAVVPLAVLGVIAALVIRGAENNTYTQIGIVLLVALASKNAILIVEFARELRRSGRSIREASAEAAKLRFRAILMTAFSSILGFVPLLVASGAGAASRQAVGNAVVGGMIAATVFSLTFVPTFFVVFQKLGETGEKTAVVSDQSGDELRSAGSES